MVVLLVFYSMVKGSNGPLYWHLNHTHQCGGGHTSVWGGILIIHISVGGGHLDHTHQCGGGGILIIHISVGGAS